MPAKVTYSLVFALILLLVNAFTPNATAQSGNISLFGDIKVDESKADKKTPLSFTIILYNLGGNVIGRQTVASGGRYRFNNLRPGEYDIAVEIETSEIARTHVSVAGGAGSDFRQDLEFEWRAPAGGTRPRADTISAADLYNRTSPNEALFKKAQTAVDKKKYDEAVILFKQLLENDKQDFQAWTELGTTYLLSQKQSDAEEAYRHAIELRPTFALAQLNLGRLQVAEKKFDDAIGSLSKAVELRPQSAEANYLLGEAYLQVKKGSKAVAYFGEALKLDPVGMNKVHLRLAALYNAAGLKERAAAEYEEFLKKQPDYPDRKKLEQYISANKK